VISVTNYTKARWSPTETPVLPRKTKARWSSNETPVLPGKTKARWSSNETPVLPMQDGSSNAHFEMFRQGPQPCGLNMQESYSTVQLLIALWAVTHIHPDIICINRIFNTTLSSVSLITSAQLLRVSGLPQNDCAYHDFERC